MHGLGVGPLQALHLGERPELGLTQTLPWQVLALARQQSKQVKVVGGGQSPSDIACMDGFMIHVGKMYWVLQVLAALFCLPLQATSLNLHPKPWRETP